MDLASVDLNLLVVFEAMMQERNVSRAAKRVGVAQPSLSNALGRLRELFNDELFIRTPREMRPTTKAFELARPINEALGHIRFALNARMKEFHPEISERTFWIAGVDFADSAALPEVIRTVRKEAPHVTLAGLHLSPSEALAGLDEGTIDLAVGSIDNPPKRMGVLKVREESIVCVVRKGHPAMRGTWDAQTFAGLPHLVALYSRDSVDPVDATLEEMGLKRFCALSVASHMVVPFVVRSTDLIACVSEGVAGLFADFEGLEFRAPPIPLPMRQINMIWSRKTENVFGLQWLRERIIESLRTHGQKLRRNRPGKSTAPDEGRVGR